MQIETLSKNQLKDNIVSLPYISAYTFRYFSDHGWISDGHNDKYVKQLKNSIDPNEVKEGDVIFISTDFMERFFEEIDSKINVRYTLITGLRDRGVDDEIAKFYSKKIIHWYAHNNLSSHPGITTIPLGFLNLHWRMDDHPQCDIRNITNVAKEDIEVSKDILVSFRIQTCPRFRQPCFDYFNANREIVTLRQDFEELRLDFDFVLDFFREVRKHKFIVCPFGNAPDCHRNWEAFSLGGIPIILKHKSMEAFYDMPAWFVDDWTDVTKYSMDKKYDQMKSNWDTFNHEKIYFEYWRKLIFEPNIN